MVSRLEWNRVHFVQVSVTTSFFKLRYIRLNAINRRWLIDTRCKICFVNRSHLDSIRIQVVAADSIRDSIRTEIDDSQVPSKKEKYLCDGAWQTVVWLLLFARDGVRSTSAGSRRVSWEDQNNRPQRNLRVCQNRTAFLFPVRRRRSITKVKSRDLRSFEIRLEFESDVSIRILFENFESAAHAVCCHTTNYAHSLFNKNINLCAVCSWASCLQLQRRRN